MHANRSNPVPHLYPLEATKPVRGNSGWDHMRTVAWLVNLAEHCGSEDNWIGTDGVRVLRAAVRFLINVVDANAYRPAVPQLKRRRSHRARRIGLGIMGLADVMYHVGVRYGSPEGQEFGRR